MRNAEYNIHEIIIEEYRSTKGRRYTAEGGTVTFKEESYTKIIRRYEKDLPKKPMVEIIKS